MTDKNKIYHLVHVVAGGEHKTPLLASQVFDRAEVQACEPGTDRPISVSVWLVVPFRLIFEKENKIIANALADRCPHVKIKMVPCIGRLKNWPATLILRFYRAMLGARAVFHCRGESAFERLWPLKNSYPADTLVFDVRGYTPLERIIPLGTDNPEKLNAADISLYEKDLRRITFCATHADKVCTVSEGLRNLLTVELGLNKEVTVIPCCVKEAVRTNHRNLMRRRLGLENNIAILYLGGVQSYQYLDELVMPFMKAALILDSRCKAVFITQNKNQMQAIIARNELDPSRTLVESVRQEEVTDYIQAMDMGLLLRMPSRIINTTQPVKFGEYLSAGLPVILEEGMVQLTEALLRYNIGFVVKLSDKSEAHFVEQEVLRALQWYEKNQADIRKNALDYVENQYTWKVFVPKERSMYVS